MASDQLIVTADLYLVDISYPYFVLLHQENSSRGEYKEIAPKLQKLGYNCLAVDLRYGKEMNFIQNETAITAQKNGMSPTNVDCEKDILAALNYIAKTDNRNKCILLGSSFSASLALKVANHNRQVVAVIAFSPAEYFGDDIVQEWISKFDKPVFAAATNREYPFVKALLEPVPPEKLTLFQPTSGIGVHGAAALWDNNPNSGEYWMSLLMFMKNKVLSKDK